MKRFTISIFILLFSAFLFGCGKIELAQDTITVELGEELPDIGETCLNTSSDKVLEKASIRTHKVDMKKTGTYEAYISYKKTYLTVTVIVEDTTPPEVTLKDDGKYEIGVGNSLSSEDMIESAEDFAGIESISFKDHQSDNPIKKGKEKKAKDEDSELPVSYVFYEEAGSYKNELLVTDTNGNETVIPVEITVVNDYESHVSGFQDLTVQQNQTPDWLSGITYDDKIHSVTADDSKVDMSTPGEYELTYMVTGDDKVTVFEVSVKVTVTKAPEAPAYTPETPPASNPDTGNSNNNTGSNSGTTNRNNNNRNNSNRNNNNSNNNRNNNNSGNNSNTPPATPSEPAGDSGNLSDTDSGSGDNLD